MEASGAPPLTQHHPHWALNVAPTHLPLPGQRLPKICGECGSECLSWIVG